jgi:hypothetical protein
MNIDTKDAATGSPPPQQDQAQPATTTVKLPPIPQRKSFKPGTNVRGEIVAHIPLLK